MKRTLLPILLVGFCIGPVQSVPSKIPDCTASQLKMDDDMSNEGATGHMVLTMGFRNVSSQSCLIRDITKVELKSVSGKIIDLSSFLMPVLSKDVFTLEPGKDMPVRLWWYYRCVDVEGTLQSLSTSADDLLMIYVPRNGGVLSVKRGNADFPGRCVPNSERAKKK